MTKAYSDNGLVFRTVPGDYDATTGEVLFPDVATDAELTAAFPGYTAAVAAQKATTDKAPIQAQLDALDVFLPRATEDLIEALITKNIIALTDLPAIQQTRLTEKQTLRGQLAGTT